MLNPLKTAAWNFDILTLKPKSILLKQWVSGATNQWTGKVKFN